uniref:uncharacterized protein LOC114674291 n=1 Tax=Macaca mulatta TaxID=9544 RepID=UPI0010A24385|nr:uncharacterized protein LOC114674291 [Macaca mulatta]
MKDSSFPSLVQSPGSPGSRGLSGWGWGCPRAACAGSACPRNTAVTAPRTQQTYRRDLPVVEALSSQMFRGSGGLQARSMKETVPVRLPCVSLWRPGCRCFLSSAVFAWPQCPLCPSYFKAFAKYLLCVSGGGTVEQPRARAWPQAPALQAVRCPAAHQNPARSSCHHSPSSTEDCEAGGEAHVLAHQCLP